MNRSNSSKSILAAIDCGKWAGATATISISLSREVFSATSRVFQLGTSFTNSEPPIQKEI